MDYKTAGVDVEAGRAFVDLIKESVEKTSREEVIGGIGGFGGFIRLPEGLKKPVLVAGTDGVGTKLELAQEYQSHVGVGIDLVAMCVNDVITSGAFPLFFLDYLATGKLSPKALTEVIAGISKGCKYSKCALLGGETAEMPGFYPAGKYDLAGFCVGVVEEDNIIDGKQTKVGDRIIGIESSGIHSNGFSLVRKVISMTGANKHTCFGKEQLPLIDELLKPTILYVQLVRDLLNQKIPIKAMAHITGGGLPENLPRSLPNGVDAFIDITSWQIPEIFEWLSQHGEIPSRDLWNTFNLGIGFCIVAPASSKQPIINICLENGLKAWDIGRIEQSGTMKKPQLTGLPV